MSLGTTLKSAREAKGLTTSQIAAKTHVLVQIIEGIENEDFSAIPAPIYGRGFIKLFADCVGLDPKPLQAEYTAIATGKRPQGVPPPAQVSAPPKKAPPPRPAEPPADASPRPGEPVKPVQGIIPDRTVPQPAKTPVDTTSVDAAPEHAAESEPPPALRGLALFDPAARPPDKPVPPPPQPRPGNPFASSYVDGAPATEDSPLDRFQDALSSVSHGVLSSVQRLPRNTGRIAVVSLFAVLFLIAAVWGVVVLYKATSSNAGEPQNAEPAKEQPVAKERPSEPAKERPAAKEKPATGKPVKSSGKLHATGAAVPALYID